MSLTRYISQGRAWKWQQAEVGRPILAEPPVFRLGVQNAARGAQEPSAAPPGVKADRADSTGSSQQVLLNKKVTL